MAAKPKADVIPLFRRSQALEVAAEIAVGGKPVPDRGIALGMALTTRLVACAARA